MLGDRRRFRSVTVAVSPLCLRLSFSRSRSPRRSSFCAPLGSRCARAPCLCLSAADFNINFNYEVRARVGVSFRFVCFYFFRCTKFWFDLLLFYCGAAAAAAKAEQLKQRSSKSSSSRQQQQRSRSVKVSGVEPKVTLKLQKNIYWQSRESTVLFIVPARDAQVHKCVLNDLNCHD